METTKSPRYYFDLRKERKSAAKAETAYTPATSLFAGLAAAFDYLRQMGTAILRRVAMRSSRTRSVRGDDSRRRRSAGPELFSPSCPAAALTAVARRRPPIPGHLQTLSR